MVIDEKKSTLFSRIGSRAAFGMAMFELAPGVDDLMVLTGDTSTSAGLDRFKKKYSEHFLDTGIAEQNMMGIAAGMASEGFNVVTATFSPFQTLRCLEQIKMNLAYMQHKVVFVGLASGVVLGNLGYSHCSVEDIGVLRSIPNLTILSPADGAETAKATAAALKHPQSVYLRLTGGANAEIVYTEDYNFEIGKGIVLKDGEDIAIFASGTMVAKALEAAHKIEQFGKSCSVINMHTIKPIDAALISDTCKKVNLIVSVEEHSVIGGLGSAIAEASASIANKPPHIALGINDSYEKSGAYEDILEHHKLTPEGIATSAIEGYKSHV